MAKYRVSWTETRHVSAEVEADSEEQAERIVTGQPENEDEQKKQDALEFEDEMGSEGDVVVDNLDEQRERILAEAALTECCKACHGSGRVLDDEASVLKTTCMACLGTGRVDKQQQR